MVRQARLSAENFNLDRMNHLMQLLGNPERNYPVVHIAGTKGKGSNSRDDFICAAASRIQGGIIHFAPPSGLRGTDPNQSRTDIACIFR